LKIINVSPPDKHYLLLGQTCVKYFLNKKGRIFHLCCIPSNYQGFDCWIYSNILTFADKLGAKRNFILNSLKRIMNVGVFLVRREDNYKIKSDTCIDENKYNSQHVIQKLV
jgi:hypothetical protein